MSDEPTEYTEEEVRKKFLQHVNAMVEYWNGPKVPKERTQKERLEGLAFSIMVLLDGGTSLPGFQVIPSPHPEDKEYNRSNGDRWYPDDCDIAGGLHELLHKV